MVKQPDIPAGSEAEDEPAGPATDPLAVNGPAWQAADPPVRRALSARPAADPPAAAPAADPPAAAPAADSPSPRPAVNSSSPWPAAEPSSPWPAPEPAAPWPALEPAALNEFAWPAASPPAGEPFGAPPTDPFLRIPAGTPGPPPAEGDQPPAPPRTGPSVRLWLTVAAALLGVAGLAISLVGVAGQVLPRRFTAAQQQQIMSWQVASRWRAWPAGKIFPASVSYQLPSALFGVGADLTVPAHRVGIAPQAGCSAAVDPALIRMLSKHGCAAVLRATYTDSTGSFVVTVGVVIMHDASAARSLSASRSPDMTGLRPVPFSGTLAAKFGGRQRQMSGWVGHGPYLILYTAGYTDGRQRQRVASNPYASNEMKALGTGLADGVGAVLGAPPPAPRCPGAPGC